MKLTCYNCHGEMKETKTKINAGWGDYSLTIEGVKGYVCETCGAKMFAPEEIEMVEKLSQALAETKEKPSYLNVEETAELLRVSTQTIYNMIKSNKIKAVKFGREWRFLRKNIESMINPDYALAARDFEEESSKDQDFILRVTKEMKKDE